MNPRKNDFERAVSLLHRDGYTCVLCDRDRVLTSREHGLAPLIRLLDTNESLQDIAAADRLIGRAAALLLLAAGVKAVYGEVMSEDAHRLLSDAGVRTEYGTLVPEILNRAGTAPCPMEQAAAAVTDPAEALPVLRKAMQELQKQCEDERLQQEQEYQKKLEEMEPLMVDTLCDVYSHIFKVEAKEHKELVLKLLQDTLLKVDGTGSIIVHVAKEDYAYVQEQKGALLEEAGMQSGSVEIVSDAALARAQCMIETEGGVYDCSLDTELAELKRRLMLLAYQKS